ncbi:uncharacterized protein si:ch73-6k14.2 isoform X2 [Amphiprion ocellaris]|uniref:uncharacterized protein si:ch73-6k14.2 isoform X2 n=1 Tax=Amphiprion ocellaris TaxID=80972 RepID=UPI002410F1AC|nr:uncharacterized protein si:ch73-6k14.2 isoform X2 [Amphiprion ocellaris]
MKMKPRCLLSSVDRLPTISELQESDVEDGEPDCSSHTMEEYVDSIKELSQPALYPLHGPLRGHRRWTLRSCTTVTPGFLNSPRTSVDLSDVSLTLTEHANCDTPSRFRQNLLDMLVAQSPFAGLV